jgi:uncharacterized protein YprB with RNaseH-like and TPR domain
MSLNVAERLRLLKRAQHSGEQAINSSADLQGIGAQLKRLRKENNTNGDTAGRITKMLEQVDGIEIEPGLIEIKQHYNADQQHGKITFAGCEDILKLAEFKTADKPRLVCIDTETNGLAGGSGTIAFMAGCLFIENNEFIFYQWLLCNFSAEQAFLTRLEQLIDARRDVLISYNGKTFDIPLLNTRFALNRRKSNLNQLPHIDLLHWVRRGFASQWANCTLQNTEKNLLGFYRQDDMPGAEAPFIWQEFVTQNHVPRMVKLLEHNRHDILSLAAIASVMSTVMDKPEKYDADVCSVVRFWLEKKDINRAKRILLHKTHKDDQHKRMLANIFRREKKWFEALNIWQELALNNCVQSLENMAKYYEHVAHDFTRALECTYELLAHEPDQQYHHHRKARLQRRIARDS